MNKLIYHSPAKRWKEALPLGNGKLAAMIYGGIEKERIALNDATLWSGYPNEYTNSKSAEFLDSARKLIFEGKNLQADRFVKNKMHGEYSQSFLPLADIVILTQSKLKKGYSRILDLENALFTVENEGEKREAFVSNPENAMFYRISFADKKDITISAESLLKSKTETAENEIILSGFAPDIVVPNYVRGCMHPVKYNEKKAMAFVMLVRVETDGKIISSQKKLTIKSAKNVLLKIVTQTGFCGYDRLPTRNLQEIKLRSKKNIAALSKHYCDAFDKHVKDYSLLYKKHTLNLFDNEEKDVCSLLREAKIGNVCNSLISLLYNFGKYLTISGSRNTQPLNLQGQWNHSIRPPWSSNLTANINFEMNYWATAACNLEECLLPFQKAVLEIAESGERTAKINYGAKGFACNHNVDLWRMTTPVKGNPAYMFAPLCGAWLANELCTQQKTLNGDIDESARRVIESAAEFALDYLVEFDSKLVTCPSASPEAEFLSSGKRCALDYASAFEMGIIRECFTNVITFGKNEVLKHRIENALLKLYDFAITENGLCEWHDEKTIAEKGHRHFSPLYALFPGHEIKYYQTPSLLKAAEKLFFYRLENAHNSIGWSAAWAICLCGRLHRKEQAYAIMKNMLAHSILPNLFGYHPPAYFQIDGNLGFVAGVNEMLFYEEDGVIDLLPACPSQWKRGMVIGHKINGACVSIEWENDMIIKVISDQKIQVNGKNVAPNAQLSNVEIVKRLQETSNLKLN